MRGAGGDGHQEQAQQEGPERDAVGLRELALGHAGKAAGRASGRPVMVIVRRSPAASRSKRRGSAGASTEAGSATVVRVRARRRTVEAAGTALGGLDLALPLEKHGFAAHVLVIAPAERGHRLLVIGSLSYRLRG